MQSDVSREQAARELAGQLFFSLERHGDRFSLYRSVDGDSRADNGEPVRYDDLSLDEVESLLETWKLRGFQGG
jgi:hypothetical protein